MKNMYNHFSYQDDAIESLAFLIRREIPIQQ